MLKALSIMVADICAAEDRQQLEQAMALAVRELGFVSYNLSCGKKTAREFMTAPDLTSWSAEDLLHYDRDNWADRDPLLAYAGNGRLPLQWRASDWLRAGHAEYFSYLSSAGATGGITIPLRGVPGRHNALTLLAVSDRPRSDALAAASIIAHTGQARLAALGTMNAVNESASIQYRSLSPRQREILHWAALGKTNTEIGMIMGQAKRGIDYHIGEIMRKLCVSSRVQAIVIHARSSG